MDLLARTRNLDMVRDFQQSSARREVLADEVQKLQQVRFWLANYQEYPDNRLQSFSCIMLHYRRYKQFNICGIIMWQKPLKTRSQSEGLLRAAAFEKSCPVEPTLQDFPGEGVGLGKRHDGGWVQEGEQVLHQLRSHPEHFLCLSIGQGSQNLSLYEALNIKLCAFTQRQTNAEHCVIIHSEKMVSNRT